MNTQTSAQYVEVWADVVGAEVDGAHAREVAERVSGEGADQVEVGERDLGDGDGVVAGDARPGAGRGAAWLVFQSASASAAARDLRRLSGRRLFAFRLGWFAKWVICLGVMLDRVSGYAKHCVRLILRLGCFIGDSLSGTGGLSRASELSRSR